MFYFTHAGQFQFKLPRHMYISLPYIENNSSSEKGGGGRRRCPVREEGPNMACPAFADLHQPEQKPAHTPCWSKIKCKSSLSTPCRFRNPLHKRKASENSAGNTFNNNWAKGNTKRKKKSKKDEQISASPHP
jgi:hypothetical protein